MKTLVLILGVLVSSPVWAQVERPDILEVVEILGELSSRTGKDLEALVENVLLHTKIKAVLLVVDSPGGGVIATRAAYEALSKLSVPVVVWCDGLCASGGLYLTMAPSVKFHALREETITGSIGVLASFWRYHRLLDYLKIDPERYASGILKDSGAGDQPSGALERQYLQMLVSSMAERFYAVVWKARPHISETDKEELKTAKIVFGDQAVKMKLAHAVLSREEAIRKAKELSGSKVIFTREELKKMSKAAEAVPTYGYQTPPLSESDWWIEWLREIRAGSGLRIEYLMPLRF